MAFMHSFDDRQSLAHYLDATTSAAYLDMISDARGGIDQKFFDRTSLVRRFAPAEGRCCVVGVGAGTEVLVACDQLAGTGLQVTGLDLSRQALEATAALCMANGLSPELIQSNAQRLPFTDGEVAALMVNSICHEIYSYAADGFDALSCFNAEALRVLGSDGIMEFHDFAHPLDAMVTVAFDSHDAAVFYDYFCENFRSFRGFEQLQIAPERYQLPAREGGHTVELSSRDAAEVFYHFKTYLSDVHSGAVQPFDIEWKEVNEKYLVPLEQRARPRQSAWASYFSSQGFQVLHQKETGVNDAVAGLIDNHFGLDSRYFSKASAVMRKVTLVAKPRQTDLT